MNKINKVTSNYFYKKDFEKKESSLLSQKDYEAILSYTSASSDSIEINRALRAKELLPSRYLDITKRLDSLFLTDYSTNDFPMKVYRGLKLDDIAKDDNLLKVLTLKNKNETTFIDKGFVSTSTSANVAENFKGRNGILLEINVPANSKYLDLYKLTKNNDHINSNLKREKEYLFPRNSKFKVLSFDERTRICKVEYMGEIFPKPSIQLNFDFI